jgi:hypothetical protein
MFHLTKNIQSMLIHAPIKIKRNKFRAPLH